MRRIKSTFAAAIAAVLLALAAPPASADEEGIRVLVRSGGGTGAAWSVSLASALARSALLDSVIPCPPDRDPAELAARLSCALAVDVESDTPAGKDAVSRWKILDPLTYEALASGTITGPSPTTRELAEYWWIPLVEAAETSLPKVKKTLVRVSAAPGTTVTGLSEEPLLIPEEGFLDLPLRVPVTLPWRAVSKGAYPESGYFAALEQGMNLEIPRRPLRLWSVEAGLTMLSFPEVWAHRNIGEDIYFIRFGMAQYLAGLYLTNEEFDEDPQPAILSLPLVMPGAGFGMYFLPSDAYVRPYGYASVFARILLLRGAFGFDTVAPIGTNAFLGAEWRAFPGTAVFFELGAAFYPFCDGFLMAASRGGQGNDGPYVNLFGSRWFFEAPMFRFGTRFTL